MKKDFLCIIFVFLSTYIGTFYIDLYSYFVSYQNLLRIDKEVQYLFEKQGFISKQYKEQLYSVNVVIYYEKESYFDGEVVEYTIEQNANLINTYLYSNNLSISGSAVVGIFIA